MAETDGMDAPQTGIDNKLVVELLVVGGLLALNSFETHLQGMTGNDFLLLMKMPGNEFSRAFQLKTTLSAISGMALWVVLVLRMTWWNTQGINFGLRKMPWRDISLWSVVVAAVLEVVNLAYVLIRHGAIQPALRLPQSQIEWSFFPISILGVLTMGLGPLWLIAYVQGLMERLLKHSDIVPWVVALIYGATAMSTGKPALVVTYLATGTVMAVSRYKSGYAWPAIFGIVLQQLFLTFVHWL